MTSFLIDIFIKEKDKQNLSQMQLRAKYGLLAGWVGVVSNLFLALAKLFAGLFSGSIAIVADAVNNFSDMASSVVTIVGFRLASKPADEEHPFGHARFEYIAGLCVAVMVMVIGLELAKTGLKKIISPEEVHYSILSVFVLLASAAAKLWMAFFYRGLGRRIGSATLQAAFVDSRNDAISTAAVLAAVLFSFLFGYNLDGFIGLIVAVFILVSGISLVKDTLNPLLGSAPEPQLVQYVSHKISSYPGVLGTHDLIVHDYGPARRFASAHVEMDSKVDVLESHDIIDEIERDFAKEENMHLIIHYDPVDTGGTKLAATRALVESQVQTVHKKLSIHDFRIEEGHSHVNYIFDVVAPQDCTISDEELKRQIAIAIQPNKGFIHAKITIDRSYAPIPI